MTWSMSIPSLATRAFSPTATDRVLKERQRVEYVRDLWILLGSVLALLTVIHWLRVTTAWVFPPHPAAALSSPSEKKDPEAIQPGKTRRASWRRIPHALASGFRVVAFRINVPVGPGSKTTIAELLFVFGYITTMFTLTFVNSKNLFYWFYEDRAVHIACSQLPLIVALAGKNSVISFLTGISHEKLNILHRAAARTCLILIWIHALTRIVSGLPAKFDLSHAWVRWGATALAAFTLATICSLRPIRNAFFEFFLITHIVLIGIFLVGAYLHTRDPGFGDYIWPALVFWAFDRVLRAGRLFYNNRIGISKSEHESTATIELLSPDTVRLTLRRRFNWKPGQHAYVILPSISKLPTEAHPFTIASIPRSLDGTSGPEEKDVVFLIRGRTGFTQRLRDQANSKGNHSVPALVDGPYGCPPDLTKYTTCILVAGGSGVSYTLPLLLNLVHKARANKSSVQRVVFVWSVRDAEHVNWISKALNEALYAAQPSSLVIDPRVYITGPNPPSPQIPTMDYNGPKRDSMILESPISPSDSEKNLDFKLPSYSALKITHGRPSVRKMLHEEISVSRGPVSVDVAGPSGLSQSVSKALASRLTSPVSVLRGVPSVTLHIETFGNSK